MSINWKFLMDQEYETPLEEVPFLTLRAGTLVVRKDQPMFEYSTTGTGITDYFSALIVMSVEPLVLIDIHAEHILYDLYKANDVVGVCDVSQATLRKLSTAMIDKTDFLKTPFKLEIFFSLNRRHLTDDAMALIKNGTNYFPGSMKLFLEAC